MIIESRAYARAGLLGNPSDGYHGKTISFIIRNFGVSVLLFESPELVVEDQPVDLNRFRNIYHLAETVNLTGYYGGTRLIKASIIKFLEYCEANKIKTDNKNFTIRYQTSIPRQVGLAGSSAIVIATLKALIKFYRIKIPPEQLPGLALSAEVDELGINAGLQDRVIQAYEGCVYMDFDKEYMNKHKHGVYEIIEPELLPQFYLAYKTELGKVSGKVLNTIKTRYDAGDKTVINTLSGIAGLAEEGKKIIFSQDYKKLNDLINRNFDLRSEIMNISESNKEMIKVARDCGASAKFPGSGGAIIGLYKDDEMLRKLILNLKKINARVIKPYIK